MTSKLEFIFSIFTNISFSLDDTMEQNHNLFQMYRDPCRAGPGKEKPWVIGVYNCKPLE